MSDKKAEILLSARGLTKRYQMGAEEVLVLNKAALEVPAGKWICVLGASGSGKSTLLHLLGALDNPDEGQVIFEGRNIFEMAMGRRDQFRNRHVGFVFQFYHLLPELNVLENTMLAGMICTSALGWMGRRGALKQRAMMLLEKLGLGGRLKHKPSQLSGGERQRVAIARALINEPRILLADEPTGNLDRKTGEKILDMLAALHQEGQTIVMVTHDLSIARRADITYELDGGKLQPR